MNFEDIPKELITKYSIVKTNDGIDIHKPSYINVDNPTYFMDDRVLAIMNDKVNVTLWINVYEMHVTVY